MNRRTFFQITSAAAVAGSARAADPIPIIDTHIHLFDPTRPEGVPWPPKDNAVLYKPALPDRLRKIAGPLGVVGAIKVEASPWLADNQWVLDVIEKDSFMVGMVGNLEPGKPDFREHLDRLHKNKLFLGIRYGNLWGRDLAADLSNPDFIAGLKALAAAGLELDSAGPSPALLKAILRIGDLVPDLRIVVDHLPQMTPPTEASAQRELDATMREIAKRPRVFFKVSEVFRQVDGKIPTDLDFYLPRIDQMWDLFGEDRLLYGSDWPNSDNWKPYPDVLGLVQKYFTAKGRDVAEKFFWKNSVSAYHWVKRNPSQPGT